MTRFTIPRDIYFGKGTLEELKNIKGKKAALVIGSGSIKKSGALAKIIDYLQEAKIETITIEDIEADPSIATVRRGVTTLNKFEPDWIIGIGGGSPIDAAKAMWIFYENPDFTFAEAAQPFNLPTLREKARFIAIPTTSGTGTEVTAFSIISDNEKGIKYPIADFNITPDIAIIDSNLTKSMPPTLVAHTGMDALTHALEAYVSTMANEVTDALAQKSVEMIQNYLLSSFDGDLIARDKMHVAQCLAGMSFSNAILGIVHSMSHKTGKIFSLPHGCANAIYLPVVIHFNALEASTKYADLARRLGLSGNSCDELVDSLIGFVKHLNNALGIPATLKEYGVSEEMFLHNLDTISSAAVSDPCTGTNPRPITTMEMKGLFMKAYYGH